MGGLEPPIQGNNFQFTDSGSGWPGQARPWRMRLSILSVRARPSLPLGL